ncbi:MAG: methyltransferase family protein [Candidatus Odinarchaeota archaeon]
MLEKNIIEPKNNYKFSIGDIILTTIFSIAFIIQLIFMFIFSNELGLTYLMYIGYIIWPFSIYFAVIPFITFKKRGGVEKGKSYLNTTKVVDKGPYAIIRHPQYLGGILFSITITLWTQLLISLILSIIIIILTYQWTYSEDKKLIEKFGEEYRIYREKVPRLNPILGIIKYFSQQKQS